MTSKKKTNQIKITLPLIALCIPLFANHHVTAESGCPFDTYLRLESKCVDISQQELNEIVEEINDNSIAEVSRQI